MKKFILAILAFGVVILHGQNPTLVRTTNGLLNYPPNIISGSVRVGLNTNLTGFAAGTSLQWNGTTFVWASAGGSGIPTNWTWSSGNPFVLTNTTTGAGFDIATTGGQTNSAASFYGKWTGAIDFGDAAAYQLKRATGGRGWSFVLNPNANIDVLLGGSTGIRGSARGSGVIASTDGQTIYYSDVTAGSINIILPAVNLNDHKIFKFNKTDISTNVVNICTASGTLMSNGRTNFVLRAKGEGLMLWSNPGTSTWDILENTSYPKHASRFHHEDTIVTGNAYLSAPDPLNNYNFVTYQSTAAINDLTRGYVNLKAGTYTFSTLGIQNNNGGIQRVLVDDVSVGTIDWYAAVIARNVTSNITSITIPSSGTHKVEFLMDTKNAASSDYYLVIQKTWWTWTGD